MRAPEAAAKEEMEESLGEILRIALKDPSYMMIFVGFFSCGYQLAFITAHFPALITEMSAPIDPTGWCGDLGIETTAALGGLAISVIGAANIVGTLLAGWAGKRFGKKWLLSGIYAGRSVAAAWFILTPITANTVMIFSAAMGFLWLATVPSPAALSHTSTGSGTWPPCTGSCSSPTSLAASSGYTWEGSSTTPTGATRQSGGWA